MKRSFTVFETILLVASVGLVSLIGARAHRWMWSQAELWRDRMAVQEIATTVQAMRLRAVNARRTLTMRIDVPARRLQLMAVDADPLMQESVERTIWLPAGLEIRQAPDHVTASPAGVLSPLSMVIDAPAFEREFQLQANPSGTVRLHEEPST